MREETKRQVRELYAKKSRFSGAIIAVVAVWFAGLFVTRLLTQEPVGEALLVMLFSGLLAAVLLSVRAENPSYSKSGRATVSDPDASGVVRGILRRIENARKLWDDGGKEDAAALIFIATAGVSRLRYPRPGLGDKAAYTSFVRDQIAIITNGAMPSPIRFPKTTKLPEIKCTENVPLEDIFYCVWRCSMLHEARWPDEVYLTETRKNSDFPTCIELPPDGRVGLPEQWILGLADAVENAIDISLPAQLKFPVYCVFSGEVENLGSNQYRLIPGKTKLPKLKIRNQQAFPLFLDIETLNAHIGDPHPDEAHVMEFHDSESLATFVEVGAMDERYVFSPTLGQVPPPSYSRESLLKVLQQS